MFVSHPPFLRKNNGPSLTIGGMMDFVFWCRVPCDTIHAFWGYIANFFDSLRFFLLSFMSVLKTMFSIFITCLYSPKINKNTYTLFDGWTDNTRGYFTSCVVPFRAPQGRKKMRAINKMSARYICSIIEKGIYYSTTEILVFIIACVLKTGC